MIDEWKRDRSRLDHEMRCINNYLNGTVPTKVMASRVDLRRLLGRLAIQRQAVHIKIREYEKEEELTEIFKNISGLSEAEAASLMREMERFKAVQV